MTTPQPSLWLRRSTMVSFLPGYITHLVRLVMVVCFVFCASVGFAQSDQDAIFNQAVQAYQQNQFKSALQQFQQVNGAHAQEAQSYVSRIKAYIESFSAAMTILQRSADERDARSVEYAIEQLQAAMAIKADGPGHPDQQIQKARQMLAQLGNSHSNNAMDADRSLCERALAAAEQHRFKEASELSCLLANDNPAYSCGGNEAVHVCQVNRDLAKMDAGAKSQTSASGVSGPSSGADSEDMQKAKAAYDANDFARARSLLQKVSGDAKSGAGEYLDKISRYSESESRGEALGKQGKYEEGLAAFLSAANIKADGPGNPRSQAARMELLLGLDEFYSGDYASAGQHLDDCAKANTGKQGLVHFYLGASKLARFFLGGSADESLHQDALNDLKLAKQAGFQIAEQDVSPRILDAYNQL